MSDRRIWLTKFQSDWQKFNISTAYVIVRSDKIFKISPNDWHVQKDFNISAYTDYVVLAIWAIGGPNFGRPVVKMVANATGRVLILLPADMFVICDKRMIPIDFGSQRSKSQLTNIEITYWSNLVQMLHMMRGWTHWYSGLKFMVIIGKLLTRWAYFDQTGTYVPCDERMNSVDLTNC